MNFIVRALTYAATMAALLSIVAIIFKGMTLGVLLSWFFPFGLVCCLVFGFVAAIFK